MGKGKGKGKQSPAIKHPTALSADEKVLNETSVWEAAI
jgi:hypothetical protein